MSPPEMLSELEKLAKRLGVVIRYEPFEAKGSSKGGLCRLRGAALVVMDDRLPTLDKIGILSEALAAFDLAPLFVPPVLRARLERRHGAPRAAVRPPLRPPVKASPRRPAPPRD